jgi:hypothetical protein
LGGGSALEGDDASGTVLKVEDEHAADPLVVHRTQRQVVDEDHSRFAGNNEEKSKKIERMRSMLYVQPNTLSCGGEKRSAYPRPAGTNSSTSTHKNSARPCLYRLPSATFEGRRVSLTG